jgi:hypothetical protein
MAQAQSQEPAKKSPDAKAAHHSRVSHHSISHKSNSRGKLVLAADKKTTRKKRKRTLSWRNRGQQKIDPERARDIQQALIREHYMDGEPSGAWDDATQKAMQKYQADHGWQSVTTPDSRALIKLGLGPDHAHLLNPESAMTSSPDAPHGVAAKSNQPQRQPALPAEPMDSAPASAPPAK